MGQQSSIQHQLLIAKPGIIIPKSTRDAMTDEKLGYIYLGAGMWKNYEVGRYAPFVQSWNVRKGLIIDGNYQPFIFVQIMDVKFQHLLQLSLRENNIQSIQSLSRLYIPSIQKLYFCQNNITSIKSLRRFYAPNLSYLSFNGNQTLETINFSYLESQFLEQLFVHLKQGSFIVLSYLAKLKSKNLSKIWLGRYNQQKQKKSFNTLTKKYGGFSMKEFPKPQCTG